MLEFLKSKLFGKAVVVGSASGLKNGQWDPKSFLFMPKHPAVTMSWCIDTMFQYRWPFPARLYEMMEIRMQFANHLNFGMPEYAPIVMNLQVEQVEGIYVPIHNVQWDRAQEALQLAQAYYFDDLVEYGLDSPDGYPQELIDAMDRVTDTYPPSMITSRE